ncbi:glycosyltransferase family 4 protein [Caenimonas sp. SL110]|uniref:glycosyltransferase family 4 protein n=1 Tax=Caenimonas sp. SL110 TaxID=1450524 RepID=UPI0006533F49|nr:glycosyltransferase family 4 protein [Caenimonas sp. SL110]
MKPGGVLFIAPSAYPLGGVAVWLDYLVPGLKSLGIPAKLALTAGPRHDAAAYLSGHPGLSARQISNPTGSAQGRVRAIAKVLAEQKPEIVVAVNIVDVYAAVREVRAKRQQIKAVMALHAIAADLLADLAREADVIDAVISTNMLATRLCIEVAHIPAERAFYAPCGVDTNTLASLNRTPREGPLRIAWIGRLENTQKRTADLPAIAARLDARGVDWQLTLAGDGPDRDALLAQLAPWIQSGRVQHIGALPADQIARVYAASDVLLVTSEWETGPLVAWEAMAARVALVTSRYVGSGLEGALQNGINCLHFETGSADDAAACLATLAREPQTLAAIALAGQQLVQHRYTVAASIRSWAEALQRARDLPPLPSAASRPPSQPRAAPQGRLDRLLGAQAGETLRAAMGIRYEHADAGDEWPHTGSAMPEGDLMQRAARIDRPERHPPENARQ